MRHGRPPKRGRQGLDIGRRLRQGGHRRDRREGEQGQAQGRPGQAGAAAPLGQHQFGRHGRRPWRLWLRRRRWRRRGWRGGGGDGGAQGGGAGEGGGGSPAEEGDPRPRAEAPGSVCRAPRVSGDGGDGAVAQPAPVRAHPLHPEGAIGRGGGGERRVRAATDRGDRLRKAGRRACGGVGGAEASARERGGAASECGGARAGSGGCAGSEGGDGAPDAGGARGEAAGEDRGEAGGRE